MMLIRKRGECREALFLKSLVGRAPACPLIRPHPVVQ